jgi:Flp pilus assembly secretin CpaC
LFMSGRLAFLAALAFIGFSIKVCGQSPDSEPQTGAAKGTVRAEVSQTDLELLHTILRKAVPTASVTPLSGADGTVILTGWVAQSEDAEMIMRIARTFTRSRGPADGIVVPGAADGLVNAMKVGGLPQVQLDVVVARANSREWRAVSRRICQATHENQRDARTETSSCIWNVKDRKAVLSFLEALRDVHMATIEVEPPLVILSGHPATLRSGGEAAVPTVSGIGVSAGVQSVPFGTSLTCLPIVQGDKKEIYLEIEVEVSKLDPANAVEVNGATVAGRESERMKTAVTIQDGQTLAIGGIISQQEGEAKTTDETVYLLTAHLVDPLAP